MKPLEKLEPADFIWLICNLQEVGDAKDATIAWLKERGLDTKKVEAINNNMPDDDMVDLISAVINAQKAIAAKAGMAKLTPEQRSERAKKAVQARIEKYGK